MYKVQLKILTHWPQQDREEESTGNIGDFQRYTLAFYWPELIEIDIMPFIDLVLFFSDRNKLGESISELDEKQMVFQANAIRYHTDKKVFTLTEEVESMSTINEYGKPVRLSLTEAVSLYCNEGFILDRLSVFNRDYSRFAFGKEIYDEILKFDSKYIC